MPDAPRTWMIYGATGYSGRLVTDLAIARGLRPILAGRSQAVESLAARHGLPSRVFDETEKKGAGRGGPRAAGGATRNDAARFAHANNRLRPGPEACGRDPMGRRRHGLCVDWYPEH